MKENLKVIAVILLIIPGMALLLAASIFGKIDYTKVHPLLEKFMQKYFDIIDAVM